MTVLWISTAANRHSRKEAVRREQAERQRAEALRRARTRTAHVAAAVASIPAQRPALHGRVEGVPAQRSPLD